MDPETGNYMGPQKCKINTQIYKIQKSTQNTKLIINMMVRP